MGDFRDALQDSLEESEWQKAIQKDCPAWQCTKPDKRGPCLHHDYPEQVAKWYQKRGYVDNWRQLMKVGKSKPHRICRFGCLYHGKNDTNLCTTLKSCSPSSNRQHLFKVHIKNKGKVKAFLYKMAFGYFHLVKKGLGAVRGTLGMSNSPPKVASFSSHSSQNNPTITRHTNNASSSSTFILESMINAESENNENNNHNKNKNPEICNLFETDDDEEDLCGGGDFMDMPSLIDGIESENDENRNKNRNKNTGNFFSQFAFNPKGMVPAGSIIPLYNNQNVVNGLLHFAVLRARPDIALKKEDTMVRPGLNKR